MDISRITSKGLASALEQVTKDKAAEQTEQSSLSFGDMLDRLSESQVSTDNLIQQLAAGEDVDIHQVMIAAEQTDINFKIALAMRDHLVEAYQEVMRMQI